MTDLAVIMSIYKNDRLTFVKQSVQSILDQTFSDFHYYLVFDGPVKPDVEIFINSLTDNRIKLYKLEKNCGLATALNFLLEIVLNNKEYKFIARMDADDISLNTRFDKQRTFLIENPEISVLGCWYEEINEEEKHLAYRKLPCDHESLRKRYYTRTPFAHPSVMYRRELIEKAGFYPIDTLLMEDNVLWGRALKNKLMFANIPEYLLKFRIDKDFYNRRSGIKYGLSYIINKNKGKSTSFPHFSVCLISFGIGLLKMFPAFFVNFFYFLHRKYS